MEPNDVKEPNLKDDEDISNYLLEPRDGKNLFWTNINMSLKGGKDETNAKRILTDVWGEVPQKQVTAIMGPSGSGKVGYIFNHQNQVNFQ